MRKARISRKAPNPAVTATFLLLFVACGDAAPEQLGQECPVGAADTLWISGETAAEHPDSIRVVLARRNVHPRGEVLYAFAADLDCDGDLDVVVQEADSGHLYLSAYRSEADTAKRLFTSEAKVKGREVVVALGATTAIKLRSIAVVGSDEGGLVPRLFVARDSQYVELTLPTQYFLRMEEEWTPTCRQINSPNLLADGRIVLSRETIPPTALKGHGVFCALPRDTLVISTLTPVGGGAAPR